MRSELQDREVLAMYDVRGIQHYIFKSNAAKEIIGASVLVEKIITDGLQQYIRTLDAEKQEHYLTDWSRDDPKAFAEDPSVEMQIMFIGGGNAYVLFRKGMVCRKVNRYLAKYILEHTYSLNLAVAVVPKTDNYRNDYYEINQEMRRIKAGMPLCMPLGAMPFMAADSVTGYPLTSQENHEYYSTEARLKRKAFPDREDEKVFDNMVTEKGDSSCLAVFHIDGNSMGNRIRNTMQDIDDYGEAMKCMRQLSLEISTTFRAVVEQMKAYMDSLAPSVKKDTAHKLYREIIVAGDDITFVCNAKLAIPAVEYFLRHIGDRGISARAAESRFSTAIFRSRMLIRWRRPAVRTPRRGRSGKKTGETTTGSAISLIFRSAPTSGRRSWRPTGIGTTGTGADSLSRGRIMSRMLPTRII